jgi:hypothetical protein
VVPQGKSIYKAPPAFAYAEIELVLSRLNVKKKMDSLPLFRKMVLTENPDKGAASTST